MTSELELTFDYYWGLFAPKHLELESEYRFDKARRWRFDRALPKVKVAVELEGGVFSGGRHIRGKGYEADCTKYNMATAAGWRIFRFTRGMLENDPETCIKQVLGVALGVKA